MKSIFALVVAISALSTIAFAKSSASSAQTNIDKLAEDCEHGSITRIELIQKDPDVLTLTAIVPKELERQADYRLSINDPQRKPCMKELIAALKNTKLSDSPLSPDVRWGLICYSNNGSREAMICFDRTGTVADVNGLPVKCSGTLFECMVGISAASFRYQK